MGPGDAEWKLRRTDEAEVVIPFQSRLRSDDRSTLKAAAIANLGIVALPAYVCRTEIQHGQLRRILPEWVVGDGQITLLAPSHRGLLPAVRALIDFLVVECPTLVAEPAFANGVP